MMHLSSTALALLRAGRLTELQALKFSQLIGGFSTRDFTEDGETFRFPRSSIDSDDPQAEDFRDLISCQSYVSPVVVSSGQIYSEEYIRGWLASQRYRPLRDAIGQTLTSDILIPLPQVVRAMELYLARARTPSRVQKILNVVNLASGRLRSIFHLSVGGGDGELLPLVPSQQQQAAAQPNAPQARGGAVPVAPVVAAPIAAQPPVLPQPLPVLPQQPPPGQAGLVAEAQAREEEARWWLILRRGEEAARVALEERASEARAQAQSDTIGQNIALMNRLRREALVLGIACGFCVPISWATSCGFNLLFEFMDSNNFRGRPFDRTDSRAEPIPARISCVCCCPKQVRMPLAVVSPVLPLSSVFSMVRLWRTAGVELRKEQETLQQAVRNRLGL